MVVGEVLCLSLRILGTYEDMFRYRPIMLRFRDTLPLFYQYDSIYPSSLLTNLLASYTATVANLLFSRFLTNPQLIRERQSGNSTDRSRCNTPSLGAVYVRKR